MFPSNAQVVRVAISPLVKSSATMSTNAATNPIVEQHLVQAFHHHFWKAAATRKLKRDDSTATVLSSPLFVFHPLHRSRDNDDNAMILRKRAREDLFKHFRMSASMRAMKRGDGILSHDFSLGKQVQSPPSQKHTVQSHDDVSINSDIPTLIDVATTRHAREDFHRHFLISHQNRKALTERNSEMVHSSPEPSIPQLQHFVKQHRLPLPTNLNEAYLEFGNRLDHPRAMAVTETEPPFKIVDVNNAWIDLCGYSREEAVGSTLKALLQGPDTNLAVAKSIVSTLAEDKNGENEAILINYRSDGRKFRNHIRVGPLKNEITGETSHLIGVFKKLSDDTENDGFYANA